MTSISKSAAAITAESAKHLPADLLQVFAGEQRRWREHGEPDGIVRQGEQLDDFELPDATGSPVSLSELVADGPAVIVFYRGGWCPYCNLALRTYQAELLPELARFGARLVAISPENPDQSLTTSEKAELSFTVLSDPGAAVAARLGLAYAPDEEVLAAQRELGLDLARINASVDLPIPTVLIVDPGRSVRFIDPCPDYTTRTEVPRILGALESLADLRDTATPGLNGGAP
jgi:peroxiredoxin